MWCVCVCVCVETEVNCVTLGRLAFVYFNMHTLHSIFEVLVIVKTLYEYSLGKVRDFFF